MKNKIIISLEGQESNTESNFIQQLNFKYKEFESFEVFSLDGIRNKKELLDDVQSFIKDKEEENQILIENQGIKQPSIFIYLIFDMLPIKRKQNYEKLISNAKYIKNNMNNNYNIKIISYKKGFEIGVIGSLFIPPITSIKVLCEKFCWTKKIFKKKYNHDLLNKTIQLANISSFKELKKRLKNTNNKFFHILND